MTAACRLSVHASLLTPTYAHAYTSSPPNHTHTMKTNRPKPIITVPSGELRREDLEAVRTKRTMHVHTCTYLIDRPRTTFLYLFLCIQAPPTTTPTPLCSSSPTAPAPCTCEGSTQNAPPSKWPAG